jgi:branched-chain amino acid transport system permease protein
MTTFVQVLIGGAVFAAAYSLIGIGYNLAYSTFRVINFAQGQLYMLGAMVYVTALQAHLPVVVAVLGGLLVAGIAGVAVERVGITPILSHGFKHGTVQASLLATVAAGIVIENGARLIWGTNQRHAEPLFGSAVLHLGSVAIGVDQLTAIGGAVLGMLATWVLLQRTSIGLQIRAIASNPLGSSLQGVRNGLVISFSFFLSGVLGGLAGILLSALGSASVSVGLQLSILGLIAAMLGTLGNMRGLIPAAFAVGVLQTAFSTYVSTRFGDDLALVVVLCGLVVSGLWVRRARGGRTVSLAQQSAV